jgi:hypothetical protein
MPASLKGALVRETARRGVSLNDVAVGMLAEPCMHRPTVAEHASGLGLVILLRMRRS